MNTNHLKKFAREARIKLRAQVEAKLRQVLRTDSIALREKANQVKELRRLIAEQGEKVIVEKAAYLWFNRFMALRFMDVKEYTKVRVVSPLPGDTLPELLQEAKNGNIADELELNRARLLDLLDGKIPSDNPQNEAYQLLLVAACNHWSTVMPFLFQRIDDYSELLMPDDVLSAHSIIQDVRDGMTEEDCREVEVIGWLYQFYIAERKKEVDEAPGKVPKEDIPAATQLFTPRWIVEYMVQNTLGKLWLQNRPNSQLRDHMPYYIESATSQTDDFLRVQSVEEITLLDQACGSGHILAYAFDLFAKIYEEEGYDQSKIPLLILENNLFGFEIDERAAQLAAMTLMMKARGYHRRVFRKKPMPQILHYQDLQLSDEAIADTFRQLEVPLSDFWKQDLQHLRQATNLGSLLLPQTPLEQIEQLQNRIQAASSTTDIFLKQQLLELEKATQQLTRLARKYHCVVDNPPYMGGGKMNAPLSNFVKKNYPDSKADLMACFMESGLAMLQKKGFLGMINQHSWMFNSSYRKLRKVIICNSTMINMLHLGSNVFDEISGEIVQSTSFVLQNEVIEDYKGIFLRLVEAKNSDSKKEAFLIEKPFQNIEQKGFLFLPSETISYWITEKIIEAFEKFPRLGKNISVCQGLITGDDIQFARCWFELDEKNIEFFPLVNNESNKRWFKYNKGAGFSKWYKPSGDVVDWEKNGRRLKNFFDEKGKLRSRTQNMDKYFRGGICWSEVSTNSCTARYVEENFIFSSTSPMCFYNIENKEKANLHIAFLNSKVGNEILKLLSPTQHYTIGSIKVLPFKDEIKNTIEKEIRNLSDISIQISKTEWNSHETSWDFQQNELLRLHEPGKPLELTYLKYHQYWREQFFQLHENEEALNRLFIGIYGLEDELTPDVPLSDITLLKRETSINEAGELVFDQGEVMRQLVSYAVGCMMGRYSLDKPGLILANQGEDLTDYVAATGVSAGEWRFEPDDDGILPVLEEDYFSDDIVGRFRAFLKAAFGAAHFEENLRFVEAGLGKDIRSYFVKDFYKDHLQRYKKRPIYWKFTSPNRSFSALLYLHRYRSDSMSKLLNDYLRSYVQKLEAEREGCIESGLSAIISGREKGLLDKRVVKIDAILAELQDWERSVIYPLATKKLELNLDNGVLVNYNQMGDAVETVSGLNDAKTRKTVAGFDWVE